MDAYDIKPKPTEDPFHRVGSHRDCRCTEESAAEPGQVACSGTVSGDLPGSGGRDGSPSRLSVRLSVCLAVAEGC